MATSDDKGGGTITKYPQPYVPLILSPFPKDLDDLINRNFADERLSHRIRTFSRVRTRLRKALRKALKGTEFILEGYGSTMNGFGSIESDLDVCFSYVQDFAANNEDEKEKKQIETINMIANALKAVGINKVEARTKARIPIVHFEILQGQNKLHCEGDISCRNELAIHNTRLLKRYCIWTNDNLLSKLGIFVKKWAKYCDIGEASEGSLSSYAICLLLIHFLQQLQPLPLLPVLQEMGKKKENLVEGHNVYFYEKRPGKRRSKCNRSVGDLFMQFLNFYAKFDWDNEIVQISRSKRQLKKDRGWEEEEMCIENPFDRDLNIAEKIDDETFLRIKRTFTVSRDVVKTDVSRYCRSADELFDKCKAEIEKREEEEEESEEESDEESEEESEEEKAEDERKKQSAKKK